MKRIYKCNECEKEIEADSAPAECECGTKNLSWTEIEIQEKVIEVKSDNNSDDEFKKLINSLAAEVKELKAGKSTDAEVKERMDNLEKDLKDGLKTKQENDSQRMNRRGEYDVAMSDEIKLALIKGSTNMDMETLLTIKSDNDLVMEFQRQSDSVYVLSKLLNVPAASLKLYNSFKESSIYGMFTKAMYDASAIGAEWVPDILSAQMIEMVDLQLKVAAIHPRFTMPGSPYKMPGVSSHLKAYRRTTAQKGSDAPTKFTASQRATRDVTFTAELLAVRSVFDVEFQEDSIVPVLDALKSDIAFAIAGAIEATIINGDVNGSSGIDSGGTDMHGDSIGSDSPEASWDGYRKHASDINAGSQTAVVDLAGAFATSGSSYRTARGNMKKYGINANDLVVVSSITGYLSTLMNLNDIQTVDKYGANAVIITGEVGKIYGSPVVVSDYSREDLNGSGVSAGASSGNADMAIQIVNKGSYVLGDRRRITIESSKIQGTDSMEIWATWRGDFQAKYATSEPVIHNMVDID